MNNCVFTNWSNLIKFARKITDTIIDFTNSQTFQFYILILQFTEETVEEKRRIFQNILVESSSTFHGPVPQKTRVTGSNHLNISYFTTLSFKRENHDRIWMYNTISVVLTRNKNKSNSSCLKQAVMERNMKTRLKISHTETSRTYDNTPSLNDASFLVMLNRFSWWEVKKTWYLLY